MTCNDVIDYWFAGWDDARPMSEDTLVSGLWFGHVPARDLEVKTRFGELHARVVSGAHDDWEATARGTLAKVLVLDQFSRMLHRNSAKAYLHDADARAATQGALERAQDRELTPIERSFLYMPLMHAEDRAVQRRSLVLFTELAEEAEEAGLIRAGYYRYAATFAVRHKEVIDRFGRFPHRNQPLERTSTPEELEFLKDASSRF